MDRGGVDAQGQEGVQIQAAHLDIFHPALAQGVERALPGANAALGANGAVELVFDLEQARGELNGTIEGGDVYEIDVYSLQGRKLMTHKGNSIDLSTLSNAMYLIKATNTANKQQQIYKVIKE